MTTQPHARLHDRLREERKVRAAQERAARSRTLADRCRRHRLIEHYLPELAEALGTWPEFQDAQVLELDIPAHPHRAQQLADGQSCDTCDNFKHCRRLNLAVADQRHCDFLPSRYREKRECKTES